MQQNFSPSQALSVLLGAGSVALTLAASAADAAPLPADYAAAVSFCRGSFSPWGYEKFAGDIRNTIKLNPEHTIGCFDGLFSHADADGDVALIRQLEGNAIFVVRSNGGSPLAAMKIADALAERDATVIVDDFCLSSCANYVAVAGRRTFVTAGTLLAWNFNEDTRHCGKKIEEDLDCWLDVDRARERSSALTKIERQFFLPRVRNIDTFVVPPTSAFVIARMRDNAMVDSVQPMDRSRVRIVWTLHPRLLAATFRTEIIYEAYPESQSDKDFLARRVKVRVIVDE